VPNKLGPDKKSNQASQPAMKNKSVSLISLLSLLLSRSLVLDYNIFAWLFFALL
jgi:hypothetical protein